MYRKLVAISLGMALSWGVQAWAEPSPQDRATARALAEEADKKVEAGDIKGAIELFRRADAIFPAPTLKLAMARLLVKQNRLVEAHELLWDISRSTPQPEESPVWATARESARQEAEAMAPRISKIEIRILGLEGSVRPIITLDGVQIPNESLGIVRPIDPGSHRIHVEAEGYLPSDQNIQLGEGEVSKLSIKMFREPKPSAVRPSESSDKVIHGEGKQKEDPILAPSSNASGGRGLAVVGFVSGGVFLATGSVLGWMVSSRVSEIKKDCTLPGGACPLERRPDADSAEKLALASNISFGLAALGVGIGIYGLLLKPEVSSSVKSQARWQVGIGPSSVALSGAF